MLNIGDIVGKYRVLSFVGEGGFANVYEVEHTILGSRHALKILDTGLGRHQDVRHRFVAEGRIQAQLQHPHIVSVTDVIVEEGIAGLVLQFIDGVTLETHLERTGAGLPIAEIQQIMGPVLQAVQFAHERGIVHRDLKPGNIMLRPDSNGAVFAVVLDFGIAKILTGESGDRKGPRTRTGAMMGTPNYMSPEQAVAVQDVDERTDVFSLATIIFEMASGKLAFDGKSDWQIINNIVEGRRTPFDLSLVAGGLDRVLARALEPDRERRTPSCAALQLELMGVGDEATPPAQAQSESRQPPKRKPKPSRKWSFTRAAATSLTLGVFALSAAALVVALLVLANAPGLEELTPSKVAIAGDLPMTLVTVEATTGDQKQIWAGQTEVPLKVWMAHSRRRPWAKDDAKFKEECGRYKGVDLVQSDFPVICVSWFEAIEFANIMSAASGLAAAYEIHPNGTVRWIRDSPGYRLPTRVEWRAAAADSAINAASESTICRFGNVGDRDAKRLHGWTSPTYDRCSDGFPHLAPIGSFQPTHAGLHDVVGNVWEWVWDTADGNLTDEAIAGASHLYLGGGWATDPHTALPTAQTSDIDTTRRRTVGLRLVRNVR